MMFLLQQVERYHIYVGVKHCVNLFAAALDQLRSCSVDTYHLDPIARPKSIDVVVVGKKSNGAWGLALAYILWQLLELDILLIRKSAEVVLQFHAILCPASRATPRLGYSGILQFHLHASSALLALEVRALHLRVYLTRPDDYPMQTDQSSYISGVQILHKHPIAVMQMLEPQHQLRLLRDFLAPADLVGLRLDEVILIYVLEHMIEATDHLRRIVHKLHVDIPIRFVEVPPVHLEDRLLGVLHLDDAIAVDALTSHQLIHDHLCLKVYDEVLECLHGGLDVDVGAVDLVVLGRLVFDFFGLVDLLRGAGEWRVLGD